jgi:hypothetical protein
LRFAIFVICDLQSLLSRVSSLSCSRKIPASVSSVDGQAANC